jgi:hypothetical protein
VVTGVDYVLKAVRLRSGARREAGK